jgi:hypothetical protein
LPDVAASALAGPETPADSAAVARIECFRPGSDADLYVDEPVRVLPILLGELL